MISTLSAVSKINAISRYGVERTLDNHCYVEIKYSYIYSSVGYKSAWIQALHVFSAFYSRTSCHCGNLARRQVGNARPRGSKLISEPKFLELSEPTNALKTRKNCFSFGCFKLFQAGKWNSWFCGFKLFCLGQIGSIRILAMMPFSLHSHFCSHLNI